MIRQIVGLYVPYNTLYTDRSIISGGFRPGWQGSRTLSASSNQSDYRVSDIKNGIF